MSRHFKTISAERSEVVRATSAKIKIPNSIHSTVAFHLLMKKSLHVSSKQNGARFLVFFTRFHIKFLENAREFNRRVTWKSELT